MDTKPEGCRGPAMCRIPRLLALLACLAAAPCTARAGDFPSHPPMRPLPAPPSRPMAEGPGRFVDPARGDDRNDGSREKPWKTLQQSVAKLRPGDTLYLRGGVYHERPRITASGLKGRPITIRGHPGEMAIVDGGIREFLESPASSWEPAAGGAPGEYVSKRAFPDWEHAKLLGHFADSMVPLHGYRFVADFRAPEDGTWKLRSSDDEQPGVYLGPGLWYDPGDRRIHIRLAPTRFDWLGEGQNYRGEGDPRKLPLVIAGGTVEDLLDIRNSRHLRFQDLVLRGAGRTSLLQVQGSEELEFDGLTFFGGWPALHGISTRGLRVVNCAFRGLGSAPWESRASMKYRGKPSYMVVGAATRPLNRDWEIAWCEFTDGHDFGLFRHLGNLRFHHNLVDNFNDDGLEMGPRTRDQSAWIYCNRISRCLGLITQHESKTSTEVDPGSGIFIFRNVIDLRRPVYGMPRRGGEAAAAKDEESGIWRTGELCNDHGGPLWPNYHFYQNTVLREGPAWRNHYAFGLGQRGLVAPRQPWMEGVPPRPLRRVFNNIFVQVDGLPGLVLVPKPEDVDMQVDGNLFWGVLDGPSEKGDFFAKLRGSPVFEASKKQYPPGWGANDRFGDPRFASFPAEAGGVEDLSPRPGSPAIGAGVPLPADWPDEFRPKGGAAPDIGAIPSGVVPWGVGVKGRLPACPRGP